MIGIRKKVLWISKRKYINFNAYIIKLKIAVKRYKALTSEFNQFENNKF